MRSIIRSKGQLSELRASLRRDVAVPGDDDQVIGDFVAAVNEVVVAVLSNSESESAYVIIDRASEDMVAPINQLGQA